MRILVLHSGGLDSTVCLLMAAAKATEVISLGVNYGQTHIIELEYARKQCARLGIKRREISVTWDKPLRDLPRDRSVKEIREAGKSPAFLPGRNLVFLSLAVAEAAGLDFNEVWIGVNGIDFSGYPDCTSTFIDAFRAVSTEALDGGPAIVAPLAEKTKPQIAQLAMELGLSKADTWSCYRPQVDATGVKPCGRCDACALHNYAWDSIAHPTSS